MSFYRIKCLKCTNVDGTINLYSYCTKIFQAIIEERLSDLLKILI